jgi:hypothetical protein
MKHFNILIPLTAVLCLILSCHSSAGVQMIGDNTDSIKKIILDINDQMVAASLDSIHGRENYSALCNDSLITNNEDDFYTSSDIVARDLSNHVTIPPHDFTFRLFGTTAILSFLNTVYELYNSDTIYSKRRVTKIFNYDRSTWKMVGLFIAPQPVNYVKPVAEKNLTNYKDFAGLYKWKNGLVDTVSVKNGKLYDALTGEKENINFPINDSVFMTKEECLKVIFNKGALGKVDSYSLIYPDGQRFHAIKMK